MSDRMELISLVLERRRAGEDFSGQLSGLAAQYNDLCESAQATCAEIPGAVAMLSRLSHSLPLYLNSATPQESLKRIVNQRCWARYFRGVFGRPSGKLEILCDIARSEQVASSAIAMVGDGVADRDAAQQMGCPFFSVGDLAAAPCLYGQKVTELSRLPDMLLN